MSGYELEYYNLTQSNSMNTSGIGKINWTNVKSAMVNGVCAAFLFFLISIVASIIEHRSIFGLDWKHIIDTGIMAALGVFAVMLSFFRNFFTTSEGNFAGVVKVIPSEPEGEKYLLAFNF